MRLLPFGGKGSVRTFLAKFDNCASHNRWTDTERLHYLANCLEDPAAQILWDLRPGDSYTFGDLKRTPEAVYGGVGQAEEYRSPLYIRRRKKGETLTDLAQDVRKLMVLAYPGSQDRTTEVLARDSFLEALEDPELIVQVQAQNPPNLNSALRVAQRMEAVFHMVHTRASKPVRVVSEGPMSPVVGKREPGNPGWNS